MIKNFKKFSLLLFVSFLFANFSFAKEIRTRFGFYIDLPKDFVAIQNQNVDELLKDSDSDINKEFFNELVAGSSKQDLNVEFYYPKKLNAELNSINVNLQSGVTLREIRGDFSLNEICQAYQQMFIELFKKGIRQYECKYNNNFKPKYRDVLRTKHDGSVSGQLMIQYQLDQNRKLLTLTIGCEPKNCNYMEKVAVSIIKSIN